jgi:hypothetical protein
MRTLVAAVVLLGLGIAAGYFLRASEEETDKPRAQRAASHRETPEDTGPRREPPAPPPDVATETDRASASETAGDTDEIATPGEKNEQADPEKATEAKDEKQAMLAFLKGALPLIKASSQQDAIREAAELAVLLKLAPHREKQLADVLAKEAAREIEAIIPLLEGEEPDPAALMDMAETDGMSGALQRDLGLILNANEMDGVREHYRRKEEEARKEQIESEIDDLALPDLTDDQRGRLREVIRAEVDGEADDQPVSGEALRGKLDEQLSKEGIVAAMEERHRSRREKLAAFLTPDQLRRLDAHHEAEKKNAELAAGMFGAMIGFKTRVAPSTPEEEGR